MNNTESGVKRLVPERSNAPVDPGERRQVGGARPQARQVHGNDPAVEPHLVSAVDLLQDNVLDPADRLNMRRVPKEVVRKLAWTGHEHHIEVNDDATLYAWKQPR